MIINSEAFDLTDGVLYHESSTTPEKWCLVVPQDRQKAMILEACDGRFFRHICREESFELLRWQSWWPGMRRYCQSRLVCASKKKIRNSL